MSDTIRVVFQEVRELLKQFFEVLPTRSRAFFILALILILALLCVLLVLYWVPTAVDLAAWLLWVFGGAFALSILAFVIVCFLSSPPLAEGEKAIVQKLLDLIEGRITGRDPDHLRKALAVPQNDLRDLFNKLLRL